jgi:hypothetical protein
MDSKPVSLGALEDARLEAEAARLRSAVTELERLNACLNAELSHMMRENLSLCREVDRLRHEAAHSSTWRALTSRPEGSTRKRTEMEAEVNAGSAAKQQSEMATNHKQR